MLAPVAAVASLAVVSLTGCGVAPENAADARLQQQAAATAPIGDPAACPSPMPTPVGHTARAAAGGDPAGSAGSEGASASLSESTVLPDLTLECLGTGPAVSLPEIPGPAVLTVWASWCGPCRQEMPAFERLAEASESESGAPVLSVWGVVSEDSAEAAKQFVTTTGVGFPSVVDPDGALRKSLARPGLPVTVFVAGDGSVAGVYSGPALSYDQLLALVSEHLEVDL